VSDPPASPLLDEIFREEWGKLVATLCRLVGDIDRAEEFAQEALVTALERWPFSGVPEKPGAWLMTTAKNRALDHLRREKREREKRPLLAEAAEVDPIETLARDEGALPDDPLRLIFTCCHPALPREGQVALTLRLLGGLSTPEIAAAFLISESTAAQRIVRSKRAIRDRRLPYRIPEAAELPDRLPAVLDVVYLVFNEGYAAREGAALLRTRLCDEAIRLARLLSELMPDEPEVLSLLALLELQTSRAPTRADAGGNLVLLEDQDRSRWDRVRIERARRLLAHAGRLGAPGSFALQASIAECHAVAKHFHATDWRRIGALYDELAQLTGSPVVALNRAVAVGMIEGPEAALDLLEPLGDEPKLAEYALLPATRADFLRRLSRFDEAAVDYRRAIELTANEAERAFLEGRLSECSQRVTSDAGFE
jgi:RNA polymerase sigma-70 factor (ECF subfamily)